MSMSAKERLDDFDREWATHRRKVQNSPSGKPYYLNDRFLHENVPSKLRTELVARFDAMVNRELEAIRAMKRSLLVSDALEEARQTIAELEGTQAPEPEPEPKQFPEWPEGAEEKEA